MKIEISTRNIEFFDHRVSKKKWNMHFTATTKVVVYTSCGEQKYKTQQCTIGLKHGWKVHIFWEGHKILRNLHLTFDWHYIGQK